MAFLFLHSVTFLKGTVIPLNRIYTYYCFAVGVLSYVSFFPLQFLLLLSRKTYYWADGINHLVLRIMFFFWGVPHHIQGKQKFKEGQNYVVVANHASMLDIPMMFFVTPGYGIFVGKSSLSKIPLFGYMYRKLYIMVNRRDARSRNEVLERGRKVLKEGKNLIIFPEGTIPNKNIPKMLPFKEGAFRLAVETKTPIMPVTILDSWKIMEDKQPLRIKKHSFAAVIHDPIETKHLGPQDVDGLRRKVYDIMDRELMNWETNRK